jgi:hypothetical protein
LIYKYIDMKRILVFFFFNQLFADRVSTVTKKIIFLMHMLNLPKDSILSLVPFDSTLIALLQNIQN